MTRRCLALTLATLTLSLPLSAHAEKPKEPPQPILYVTKPLAPADRRHLLGDTFTIVKTVAQIPAPVRQILLPAGSPLDGMANPGQRYQVTDVIVGPERLPGRRLILAAISTGYSLIYDEQGGFAYNQELSLYRQASGHARLVWQATVANAPGFLNFEQLCALIRERKFRVLKREGPASWY